MPPENKTNMPETKATMPESKAIMPENRPNMTGNMPGNKPNMPESKSNMTMMIVVFVVVVAIIAFIAINRKTNAPSGLQSDDLSKEGEIKDLDGNTSMQNTPKQNTAPVKNLTTTILKPGTGEVAKAGDTVVVNYTGRLVDGTVFDSNVDAKFGHVEPFAFTLGVGQVIKGWDEGVAGMKVGEKRNLLILPAYGYGARGAGSAIPPNATLSFDVELVSIKN